METQNEQGTKKTEIELTFDQKLVGEGWQNYHLSARIENLKNPDSKQGTLGFKDALTKKQIVINAPIDEWIRILTELAKQQAGK